MHTNSRFLFIIQCIVINTIMCSYLVYIGGVISEVNLQRAGGAHTCGRKRVQTLGCVHAPLLSLSLGPECHNGKMKIWPYLYCTTLGIQCVCLRISCFYFYVELTLHEWHSLGQASKKHMLIPCFWACRIQSLPVFHSGFCFHKWAIFFTTDFTCFYALQTHVNVNKQNSKRRSA